MLSYKNIKNKRVNQIQKSSRKKIIKIETGIVKQKTDKKLRKVDKLKVFFLEKINKIDITLVRLSMEKEEEHKLPISKLKWEHQ